MKARSLWLRSGDRTCHLCLTIIETSRQATIDHLIPRSKGGREGWPNVGLAHKTCNHRRGNALLPEGDLFAIVRRLVGNPNLKPNEVYSLLYAPLRASCNEYVIEGYSLCGGKASHIAKYTETEGWQPKCNTHIWLALDAGVATMRWQDVPRELQHEIVGAAA